MIVQPSQQFTCVDLLFHYPSLMYNVLCDGRCAVPATLLSYVLGLPEDWLSRLPGSVQWYVSVSAEQPQGYLHC